MAIVENKFWVIFDTATRSTYYQDVHNLLALPPGAIIRYEYREKYISQSAVECATILAIRPKLALLAYAQLNDYERAGSYPSSSTPLADTLPKTIFCLTRFAQVVLIPPKDGENFYFFLKVLGYPKTDGEVSKMIIQPLIAAEEVPFRKWVSISAQIDAFDSLNQGDNAENWQKIVQCLATAPYQFEDDLFWRLEGPFYGKSSKNMRSHYQSRFRKNDSRRFVSEKFSRYKLSEGLSCSLDVVSYRPSKSGTILSSQKDVPAKVILSIASDSPIKLEDDQIAIDLEEYGRRTIGITSKYSHELRNRVGLLRIESGNREDSWPIGPNISIELLVYKPHWKSSVILLSYFLGSILITIGLVLAKTNPFEASFLVALGILLGILGSLMYIGKLPGFRAQLLLLILILLLT